MKHPLIIAIIILLSIQFNALSKEHALKKADTTQTVSKAKKPVKEKRICAAKDCKNDCVTSSKFCKAHVEIKRMQKALRNANK